MYIGTSRSLRLWQQTIYSTVDERRDILDLNQIRAARYKDKSMQVASKITAESLPPTNEAADLHSLRDFLQVEQWIGFNLNPAGYGFYLTAKGMYLPSPWLSLLVQTSS